MSYKGWIPAAEACANQGGHLTSIASAHENATVASVVAAGCGSAATAWIGFNDFAAEGTYVRDGGDGVSYTNWAAGEPSSFNDEDGVQLFASSGLWNDAATGATCYVCETEPAGAGGACTSRKDDCDDGESCTYDTCDPATATCGTTVPSANCCQSSGCSSVGCRACVSAMDGYCASHWDLYCTSCAQSGQGFKSSCLGGDCADACGCDAVLTCQ